MGDYILLEGGAGKVLLDGRTGAILIDYASSQGIGVTAAAKASGSISKSVTAAALASGAGSIGVTASAKAHWQQGVGLTATAKAPGTWGVGIAATAYRPPTIASNVGGGIRVLIYNKSNVLQDIPADVLDATVSTVVNGGAAEGTISFPRLYNQIGAIAEGYRVQIYLPNTSGSGWSTDPWYDGRISQIERAQHTASGRVTATLEGWQAHLDDAIVTFTLTPGVQANGQNNGQLDYGAAINWLLGQYKPTDITFINPGTIGSPTINLRGLRPDR